MEIVLNKCFGGFGLSNKAIVKIFKLKGITVYPYIADYGLDETKIIRIGSNTKHVSFGINNYLTIDPKVDSITLANYQEIKKYKPIDYEFKRTDKDLVAVVEELGDEANGDFAELVVVEIPDGYEYRIDEYDGIETAYYGLNLGEV